MFFYAIRPLFPADRSRNPVFAQTGAMLSRTGVAWATLKDMENGMIPIISAVAGLLTTMVDGVADHFKGKQELKKAVMENRVRLARSDQEFNHDWEMRQLENAGWKDDALFFAWMGFFIWSGVDPEGAGEVIRSWESLPDWFLQITFWIVAAVLGVKKIGDYLPGAVRGLKDAFGGRK
jgi:hypothetical protein